MLNQPPEGVELVRIVTGQVHKLPVFPLCTVLSNPRIPLAIAR